MSEIGDKVPFNSGVLRVSVEMLELVIPSVEGCLWEANMNINY